MARAPHRPAGRGARARRPRHLLVAQCRGEPDGVVQPAGGAQGHRRGAGARLRGLPRAGRASPAAGGHAVGGPTADPVPGQGAGRAAQAAHRGRALPRPGAGDRGPGLRRARRHPPAGMCAAGRRAAGGPGARHRRSGRAPREGRGGVGGPGPRRTLDPRGADARWRGGERGLRPCRRTGRGPHRAASSPGRCRTSAPSRYTRCPAPVPRPRHEVTGTPPALAGVARRRRPVVGTAAAQPAPGARPTVGATSGSPGAGATSHPSDLWVVGPTFPNTN